MVDIKDVLRFMGKEELIQFIELYGLHVKAQKDPYGIEDFYHEVYADEY